MCDELRDLQEALSDYASRFDAALVTTAAASSLVDHAAAIEAVGATLKALAADRAAEARDFRRAGYRSAAEALARQVGISAGVARDVLIMGRRLSCLDTLRAAAATGDLSSSKTQMVAEAAEADPSAEARLVQRARSDSYMELKDDCRRTVAAAEPHPERRRRRIHDKRSLCSWTDIGGMWHLRGRGNPEDGAQIMAAISPLADACFHRSRREGRREPEEAYRFDGLLDLAMASTADAEAASMAAPPEPAESPGSGRDQAGQPEGCGHGPAGSGPDLPPPGTGATPARTPRSPRRGARAKILIRVDLEALRRGYALGEETSEIVGYGQVTSKAIKDVIRRDDPFLAAVLTRARAVVGVAHLGRRLSAHQETALQWSLPCCSVAGCSATARLEYDHRLEWAKTHRTVLEELDPLCHWHHRLKTVGGWALVGGTGKREFVPPTDPRHPRSRWNGTTMPDGP